jgi:hypothetical protein
MTLSAAANINYSKPLSQQKKPDYVCEPGDLRVKKFGWTKSKFQGYLSIEEKTIWISAIWSKQMGKGNYSRLIKNLHKAGFLIKVPSPFPRMREICKHLGFTRTTEYADQIEEEIEVWVLPA